MTEAFAGSEAANTLTAAYAYILSYEDSETFMFLTGCELPVVIAGMPAKYNAADPQTFSPSQISHGEHGLSAEFDKKPLTVMVTTQNATLAQYFATASATRVKIELFRINTTKILRGETLTWGVDAIQLNSGLMGEISFAGSKISAQVIPQPHGSNQSVPRFYWSRVCNHVLFDGKTCKVDKATFTHLATIDEMQASQKILTLNITPPGGVEDYFRAGTLTHIISGQRAGIEWSDGAGPGGKVRIRVQFWNLDMAPGDGVEIVAGCRHILEDCRDKFSNEANYGGYPYIPNKNPTLYGV